MAVPQAEKEYQFSVFPNDFVDPAKKLTKEYGIRYAKAIWGSFLKEAIMWDTRKAQWILNRKYAEGLQSMDKYKGQLGVENSSYLNLDFTPIAIIPKYVDNIVGKFINQVYKIQADTIDPASRTEEDEQRRKMRTAMYLKEYDVQMRKMTGVPLVSGEEYVPESDEEMEIYFQVNFKPSLAMAMELALDFVFTESQFDDIKERVIRDFINLKTAAIRKYYDNNYKICVEYIDPVDVIVPYSKYDDYRNIPYAAVNKKYTIGQIATATDEFTEEQLFDIAKTYAGKNGNPAWNMGWTFNTTSEGYYPFANGIDRPWDNFYINTLEFEFLSVDQVKYKDKMSAKGKMYFEKKGFDYRPGDNPDKKSEMIGRSWQNRYQGCWIIGSEYLYNYKKSDNIPHERLSGSYNPRTCLSIRMLSPNIYDMQNKSHTERMIPHADQMTLISLKMQQFLMKATPPGIAIDVNAAAGILKGMGDGANEVLNLIKVYNQTGSMAFTSKYEDGRLINGKPIDILPNGLGDLGGLVLAYNAELQKINDIIGYNSATDGSTPDVRALVGTQKLAVQSTNNTLRPLNNAYVKLIKVVATDTSLMIQDKFEYGNGIEGFEKALSAAALDLIKISKGIPLCQYGINIVFMPDEVERAEVDEYIKLALTTAPPQIDLADAVMIKDMLKSNVKLATQMLVYRKKKYAQERMREAQANAEMNAQTQAQAAQAAAQAEVEKTAQVMIMEKEMESFKAGLDKQKMELAHRHKMEELGIQNQGKVEVAEKQNDGKLINAALSIPAKNTPEIV